jgi:hypothetical protein
VVLVARRQMAVRKTIRMTEAFIPFEGPRERILAACHDRLESSPFYEDISSTGETIRVTIKGNFLTKKSTGAISIVDDGILHVAYELANGGAIWADSGESLSHA